MKLLIYGINYHPELTGIGKYSGEMAEWLAARNHDIRVVTAPPYYPEWRIRPGYSAWNYRREDQEAENSSLTVWRCPLWVPAHPTGAKRLLHLASFAISSLPLMLRQIFWKPDVLMVIEPPLMCAPAALLVSRLCGAKSWLHVQDLEVDAAFALGILRPGLIRSLVLLLERFLLRLFDRVSTISPNMLARLVGKGTAQDKVVLFPNWVDTDLIFPGNRRTTLRAELGIPADSIVALYSGNMGEKQGLELILDAARKLAPQQHIRFLLCGDGAARIRLQSLYGNLPNVHWLPLQPAGKLNELLNTADIHMLPQRADAGDLVMPSKLTGMLASGRPVVATAHTGTQLAEIVSKCGIVVAPGDADGFAEAVSSLASRGQERAVLGASGRAYAQANMSKKTVLAAFEEQLNALMHE